MNLHLEIILAQPEHLCALPNIERSAAQLFVGWDVPDCVIYDQTSLEEFTELQHKQRLWVALLNKAAVGFAVVEPEGDSLHLEELDVDPQFGRQGIGSAIVNFLCEWATNQNYCAMTLTTYSDIPWNAPFYQKLGFVMLTDAQLTESLKLRAEIEDSRGLKSTRRTGMRKMLK